MKLEQHAQKLRQPLQVQANAEGLEIPALPLQAGRRKTTAVLASVTAASVLCRDEKPTKLVGGSDTEENFGHWIPTNTLRAMNFPRNFSRWASSLAWSPQYRFVARPINRFLGGPAQPMSSGLISTFMTDML
jgi:hypothetical protein